MSPIQKAKAHDSLVGFFDIFRYTLVIEQSRPKPQSRGIKQQAAISTIFIVQG